MKNKALLLAGLGVFALGACVQSQPATNENIADFKEALRKEEAKSEIGYHIGANIDVKTKVGERVTEKLLLKNFEADLSFIGFPTAEEPVVDGEDLQAYASFNYTEFNLMVLNPETYDETFNVSTTNGEKHSAYLYIEDGDIYLDLSAIGVNALRVEGEDQDVSAGKMCFPDALDSVSLETNGAGWTFQNCLSSLDMTEAEFDTYVLKTAFEFRKSGDSTEAHAAINAEKLRSIFVSRELADYYANVLPTIPEENQNDALVAEKNLLEQNFNAMIPSLDLDLSIKYNSKGLTAITLDASGVIKSEETEYSPATSVEFDMDLSFKVQSPSIPDNFNTSGYTDYEFDL